jgi:hypothetical protein
VIFGIVGKWKLGGWGEKREMKTTIEQLESNMDAKCD